MQQVHDLEFYENYVTPEMYGAYGDGVHDDTHAFIQAFSKDLPVHCNKKYLVTHPIEIDRLHQVYLYGGEFLINFKTGYFLMVTNCNKLHLENLKAVCQLQDADDTHYRAFVLTSNVKSVSIKSCDVSNMYTVKSL